MKFTEEKIADILQTARECGSYMQTARECKVNVESVTKYCKANGIVFQTTRDVAEKKKKKVVDGIVFYWQYKGYYWGTVNKERITLAAYMYKKLYGTDKPKGIVVWFKDGNHDNYEVTNLEYISKTEQTRRRNEANPGKFLEWLKTGHKALNEKEKKNPLLKNLRLKRGWATRRKNDPDGESLMRGAQTRKKTCEERGYYFTPEQMKEREKKRKETLKRNHGLSAQTMDFREAIKRKYGIK